MANQYPQGTPLQWSWGTVPNTDVGAVAAIPQASSFSGYPLRLGTDVPHDTPTGIGFSAYPIAIGIDTTHITNAEVPALVNLGPTQVFSQYPLRLGTDVPHDTPTGIGFSVYPIALGVDTNKVIADLTVDESGTVSGVAVPLVVTSGTRTVTQVGGPAASASAVGDVHIGTYDNALVNGVSGWWISFRTDTYSGQVGDLAFYSDPGSNLRLVLHPDGSIGTPGSLFAIGYPTSPSSGQGAYLGWNASLGVGETDFLNDKGGGTGGWSWRQWNGSAWVQVAFLDQNGAFTADNNVTAGASVLSASSLGAGTTANGYVYQVYPNIGNYADVLWNLHWNGSAWASTDGGPGIRMAMVGGVNDLAQFQFQVSTGAITDAVGAVETLVNPLNLWNNGGIAVGGDGVAPPSQGIVTYGAYADASVGTIRDSGGGWVRTYGQTGWYSQTYSAGWYMIDPSWVRVYNGVGIYTSGNIQAGTQLQSEVATGTPPIAVNSTTFVPNLNVAGVGHQLEYTVAQLVAGGTWTTTSTSPSAVGPLAFVGNVYSNAYYYFEAAVYNGAGAYAELWDISAGAAVGGSEVATSSGTVAVLRSGAIGLTAGHYYGFAYWSGSGSSSTVLITARIVGVF